MARAMGVKLHRTTPYHPESNGMIKRWHRRLKGALRARLESQDVWTDQLPWILLGLRKAPCNDTELSPCELVMGAPVVLPCSKVVEDDGQPPSDLARGIRAKSPRRPLPLSHHHADRSLVPPKLETCTHIFVKDQLDNTLHPRYVGPYRVISQRDNMYIIQRGAHQVEINISNLKPVEANQFEDEADRRARLWRDEEDSS